MADLILNIVVFAFWPLCAVAVFLLVFTAWQRRREPRAGERPSLWLLAATLAAPVVICIWADVTAGVERGGGTPWATTVLEGLAVISLGLTLAAFIRWRRQWWIALPVCAAATLAILGAAFVGAMQITDSWI